MRERLLKYFRIFCFVVVAILPLFDLIDKGFMHVLWIYGGGLVLAGLILLFERVVGWRQQSSRRQRRQAKDKVFR